MQILLTKTPHGSLIALTDEESEKIRRFRVGEVVRADVSAMRNGKFFRKWWVLVKVAFDLWVETAPQQEYRGQPVLPDFDRFRRDLTIMAGMYRPVWNARREMRIEAESVAWAKMDEERFEELYSKTIDVILQKILPGRGLTADQLRDWSEKVMEFA